MTGVAPECWCKFLWVQNYTCICWWNNYNKCLEAWRTSKPMNACALLSICLMRGCYTDQCQPGKSLGIRRPSLQNVLYDNYFKATTKYYPLKSTSPGKSRNYSCLYTLPSCLFIHKQVVCSSKTKRKTEMAHVKVTQRICLSFSHYEARSYILP